MPSLGKKKEKKVVIKGQYLSHVKCLWVAGTGECWDEAATPLSFPHINQDEVNQAKFIRKEPCRWSYLPCSLPSLAPGVHWHQWGLSSRLQRKGTEHGAGNFTALNLCLSKLWSKQQFRSYKGLSCLRIWEKERRKGEMGEKKWGRRGERKEQRKKKEKSRRAKEGECPPNVTSPALWNGFSLMLTTWYLLSI